ncbi:hypothetical protein [Rubellicoccus peritrichatus]|uniref:Uncharacterized protein n=1 Tax=Rubellicoccus peritrichatus TaxID=3080537 RepID=A0AAQ3L6F4_9BACT|nr:hypothetical protein [Puniceicoccus sp. CR14]WOO40175.1 hypothetical protein RZN69_16255 [Puniceicoccus sp. CR14]
MREIDGNVVAFHSGGTLNVEALTLDVALSLDPGNQTVGNINPNAKSIRVGSLAFDTYRGGVFSGNSIGIGNSTLSSNTSGESLGIWGGLPGIQVPIDYASGSFISPASTIWEGHTFSSLGLIPGTYEHSWGSGANKDSLILVIQNFSDSVAIGSLAQDALITVNEFTGSPNAPKYVARYSKEGDFIGRVFDVPNNGRNAGDLVIGRFGGIHVHNYANDGMEIVSHYLDRDATTSRFIDNLTLEFGGIATVDDFLFLADSGGLSQGMEKLDLLTYESSAYLNYTNGIKDVNIGLDGTLYVIPAGSSTSRILVYDADTLEYVTRFSVPSARHEAIAGAEDGTFFLAGWDGVIRHFDRTGTLLNSLEVPMPLVQSFTDIDIKTDGEIALGTFFSDARLVLTNYNLDSYTAVIDSDSANWASSTYVTWADENLEPAINLSQSSDSTYINYKGILQESTDLKIWRDAESQGPNPIIHNGMESSMFFRAREIEDAQ